MSVGFSSNELGIVTGVFSDYMGIVLFVGGSETVGVFIPSYGQFNSS